MSITTIIISFGIFFCGVFALLAAAASFLCKPFRSPYFITYMLLFFVWFSIAGFGALDFQQKLPVNLFGLGLGFYTLAVPFIYFSFRFSMNPDFRIGWKEIYHLLGLLIIIVYNFSFHMEFGSDIREYSFLEIYYNSPGNFFQRNIAYIPIISFTVVITLMASHTVKLKRKEHFNNTQSFYVILSSLFLNIVQVLLWFFDKLLNLGFLWYLYIISGSFIIIAFFITIKDLDLYRELGQVKKVLISKTTLTNINEEDVMEKLNTLFGKDKIYRYSELTLDSLADRLPVTPHQLSEILNNRYKKNFSSFVNFYRIEDAKNKLEEDSNDLIVQIGYDVGFNSSSSFFRSFKKETGMTPSDYKKEQIRLKS